MNSKDIEKRLRAGESAEDIAKDFTTKLNAAIAVLNKEKDIQSDAQLTADSWNHFVKSYFAVNQLPKDMTEADFNIIREDVIKLLEAFVKTIHALNKYDEVLTNAEENLKKFQDTDFKKCINKTTNSFDKVMKDFFKEMHI